MHGKELWDEKHLALPASQAFTFTMTIQIPPSAKSLLEDFGFRNDKDKLALYQRTLSFLDDENNPERATMSLKAGSPVVVIASRSAS